MNPEMPGTPAEYRDIRPLFGVYVVRFNGFGTRARGPVRFLIREGLPMRSALVLIAASIVMCCTLGGCVGGPSAPPPDPVVGPGKMTTVEIQSELMSFTDTFIGTIAQAWNRADSNAAASRVEGETLNTERIRRASHEIKLANVTAAVDIAASANPVVGVADMVTLITLQRMNLEEEATAATYGRVLAGSLAATYRQEEARINRVAARVFTEQERNDLNMLIGRWKVENPTQRYVSGVRLEDYGRDRAEAIERESPTSSSFLQKLGLQLDPATREVEKTRVLGERIFFYTRHMPQILRWQGESFYLGFFQRAETKSLFASIKGVSEAAERVSLSVEKLPENIKAERTALVDETFAKLRAEREATLNQVFEHLTEQRQQALKDFDAASDNLNGSLKELQTTIAASDSLVGKVSQTIGAADALASRFAPTRVAVGPGAPEGADTGPVRDPLTEYNAAAIQTGATVDKLTELMTKIESVLASPHWDRSNTIVQSTVATAQGGAKDVVDYAFWRLAIVVIVAPVSVALAMGLYRRLATLRHTRT